VFGRLVVLAVIGLLIVSGVELFRFHQRQLERVLDTYPGFRSAYSRKLGKPKSVWQDGGISAYQNSLEKNAMVVWLASESKFYALKDDNNFIVEPDYRFRIQTKEWNDETWLREKFKAHGYPIPPSLHPPRLGLAVRFLEESKTWQQMGWTVWDCIINEAEARKIFFQEFEHGEMIGPFRQAPATEHSQAEVFILLEDHSWDHKIVEAQPPKCIDYWE